MTQTTHDSNAALSALIEAAVAKALNAMLKTSVPAQAPAISVKEGVRQSVKNNPVMPVLAAVINPHLAGGQINMLTFKFHYFARSHAGIEAHHGQMPDIFRSVLQKVKKLVRHFTVKIAIPAVVSFRQCDSRCRVQPT